MQLSNTAFLNLNTIENLEINNCDLGFLKKDCLKAISHLRSLTLDNPQNYKHISFNNLVNLSSLSVASISDISMLKKFYPRITRLNVSNSINKQNFAQFMSIIETHFTFLKSINLSLNDGINHFDINSLPKDIKLETLNLSNSRLTTVNLNDDLSQQHSDVKRTKKLNTTNSKRLEILKDLSLSINPNIKIDVGMFKNIPRLDHLDLSYCSLRTIQRGMFFGLINLKNLELCGNNIETLEDNIFADLKYLESLNLSYNRIGEVSEATFCGMVNLKYLYLYQNPLKPVDVNIFIKFKQLKKVQLNSNNVKNRQRFKEIYGSRILFSFNDQFYVF